jgi:hypothetical protein
MLADMSAALLESPAMPPKPSRPAQPSDEVRCVLLMTRVDRARFKFFCEARGLDMEEVGARWIMERLALEESKRPPK